MFRTKLKLSRRKGDPLCLVYTRRIRTYSWKLFWSSVIVESIFRTKHWRMFVTRAWTHVTGMRTNSGTSHTRPQSKLHPIVFRHEIYTQYFMSSPALTVYHYRDVFRPPPRRRKEPFCYKYRSPLSLYTRPFAQSITKIWILQWRILKLETLKTVEKICYHSVKRFCRRVWEEGLGTRPRFFDSTGVPFVKFARHPRGVGKLIVRIRSRWRMSKPYERSTANNTDYGIIQFWRTFQ